MSGARNEERVEEGNRQMKIRKYTKNRSWRAFDILYGGAKERPAWKTKRIIGKKKRKVKEGDYAEQDLIDLRSNNVVWEGDSGLYNVYVCRW